MQTLKFIAAIGLIGLVSSIKAQTKDTTKDSDSAHRDYHFAFALGYDLYNSSINTRSAGKILHDVFMKGLTPKIKHKTVRNISEGVLSFATVFSTMIWSHEFGHMLRAKQIGGKFTIEKYSFPIIYGKMHLPAGTPLQDNALSVAGGFEVNYLMVKDIQLDLYKHNRLYNDELSLCFSNRIMFPIYFSAIAPVDPKLPNTWINTMGDPVHWIKPIWESTGNTVIDSNNIVNPALVSFYKKATLASVFWNFADVNFYREVAALFGNSRESKGAKYLIGTDETGWGYGTFFNTSILGAELNLTNYVRLKKKLFTVNLRYGFPVKNIGFGLGAYDILKKENLNFDLNLDVWEQEYFGYGFAATTTARVNMARNFEGVAQLGYKSKGYLIGRKINEGFIGNFGVRYTVKKK